MVLPSPLYVCRKVIEKMSDFESRSCVFSLVVPNNVHGENTLVDF